MEGALTPSKLGTIAENVDKEKKAAGNAGNGQVLDTLVLPPHANCTPTYS